MPGTRRAIIVLPAPGGPTSSRLCPPAAAISSARRASSCPRTSARSGGDRRGRGWRARTDGGGRDAAGIVQRADRLGERRHGEHVEAGDDRRFARVGAGSSMPAHAVAPRGGGNRQHAARRVNRSVERQLAEQHEIARSPGARRCPAAARMPSAIGRSNDAPALRTSAGARFTVMRCGGNSKPELRMALRTRSRLSRTLASGRPDHRERSASRTTRRLRREPDRRRRRTRRPCEGWRACAPSCKDWRSSPAACFQPTYASRTRRGGWHDSACRDRAACAVTDTLSHRRRYLLHYALAPIPLRRTGDIPCWTRSRTSPAAKASGPEADDELETLIATAREERSASARCSPRCTTRSAKLAPLSKSLEQVTEKATTATATRLDDIAKRLTSLDDRTKELEEVDKRIQALKDAARQAEADDAESHRAGRRAAEAPRGRAAPVVAGAADAGDARHAEEGARRARRAARASCARRRTK